MSKIQIQVENDNIDTTTEVGEVFNNSFATETNLSTSDIESMVEQWVDIVDQPEVLDEIAEEAITDSCDDNCKEVESEEEITDSKMVVECEPANDYSRMDAIQALDIVQ